MPQVFSHRPEPRRKTHRDALLAAGLLAVLAAPGHGQEYSGQGYFDPAGLRGSLAPVPACGPDDLSDTGVGACAVGLSPSASQEAAWSGLPFEVDYSIGLRGAYVREESAESYQAIVAPRLRLSHEGVRTDLALEASAELIHSTQNRDSRLAALTIEATGNHALSRDLAVNGLARFSLEQASASDPAQPVGGAAPPAIATGEAELGLERRFGPFLAGLRLGIDRTTALDGAVLGGLVGGSAPSAPERNFTGAGVGLRVSYALTPAFSVFGDAEMRRIWFDIAEPGLGTRQNGTFQALRVGVAADRTGVLTGEASVGIGLRRFDDAALGEAQSLLYDATLTYRPNATLSAAATLSSELGAARPGSGAAASATHRGRLSLAYALNSRLGLRASAEARRVDHFGVAPQETSAGFGAGIDYALNRQTTVSGDYALTRRVEPMPVSDTHRFTLGLTFTR